MSEVLLFSDLHCYRHKGKDSRLEDCLKALNWVFDVAEERGIKNILFGGDLFHDREKIEVYTYQRTFEVLENRLKSNKFCLYLLLGNHDLWYNDRTSVSSVVPLSALPGIKVVSTAERINIEGCNWDFVPFTHNPIETLAELKNKPGKAQYALGHIALDGAILHGSHRSDVSIEHDGDMTSVGVSIFTEYKHTFLGHYHAEQRVNDKVEYIGSPLELSFGEAFQEKHLIVFNGKTGNREYIKNEFSPKHLIIAAEDRNKYQLDGNFVKLKLSDVSATDVLAMRKEILEQNNLGSLEIQKEKKKIDEHVIQNAKALLYRGEELLEKYVDQVGTKELDRTKLLQIGKKICQTKTT